MKVKDLITHWSEQVDPLSQVIPQRHIEDLLAYHMQWSWSELQLNKSQEIPFETKAKLEEDWQRLSNGEPLAYILGQSHFFESTFKTDQRALIPRPETEILVETILQRFSPFERAVDLGTGTGCIGLSLAKRVAESQIYLVDTCPLALALCRENQQALGIENVTLVRCKVGEEPSTQLDQTDYFDVIVSNPPYIEEGDVRVEKSVRDFEPGQALYAQEKGLYWIRLWLSWVGQRLKPGGVFLFEFGLGQERSIQELISNEIYTSVEILNDYSGQPRFFVLQKAH
jgi:release factor glutamine methyltransferase